jgi:hypothetical protein
MKREDPFPSLPSRRPASFPQLLALVHWPTVGGAAALAALLLAVLIGFLPRPARPRTEPGQAVAAREAADTLAPGPRLVDRPVPLVANGPPDESPSAERSGDVPVQAAEEARDESCTKPAPAPQERQADGPPAEPELAVQPAGGLPAEAIVPDAPRPEPEGPIQAAPAAARAGRPRSFGTALTFAVSPRDAGRQALRQRKLVFLLHVSGNFEKSEFT